MCKKPTLSLNSRRIHPLQDTPDDINHPCDEISHPKLVVVLYIAVVAHTEALPYSFLPTAVPELNPLSRLRDNSKPSVLSTEFQYTRREIIVNIINARQV